jgi:hypothetical protein
MRSIAKSTCSSARPLSVSRLRPGRLEKRDSAEALPGVVADSYIAQLARALSEAEREVHCARSSLAFASSDALDASRARKNHREVEKSRGVSSRATARRGSHRGRRRAPERSIPSMISPSSAASITLAVNVPSSDNFGRNLPRSKRFVHIAIPLRSQ